MQETLHLPAWWTWWYLWSFFKFALPVCISALALWYVLYDRRPRLLVKTRKGLWSMLRELVTVRGTEMMFQGTIEVYNLSSRANAIRNYEVFAKSDGEWIEMEAEYSHNDSGHGKTQVYNESPLALAPYSGCEVRVLGLAKFPKTKEVQMRITIEDLFGKRYTVEMTSYS